MLGGLIVWAAHFVGVYALASAGEVAGRAHDPAWRWAILAFTGLCAAAVAALLWRAVRELRRPPDPAAGGRLVAELSALGSGIALLAIAWQTLPAVVGY